MSTARSFLGRPGSYFRWDIYRRMMPYMRPYRAAMIVGILLTFAQSAFTLLDPWPMKLLIDSGLGGKPLPHWLTRAVPLLASGDGGRIIVFVVAGTIALKLAGDAINVGSDYLKTRINAGMTLRFQAHLFNHLQRLSFSYHDQTSIGDSMYRLNTDTGFVNALIWGNFRHLLTSTVTLAGILWIVIRLDWQIALLAVAASPFLYGAVGVYATRFKGRSKSVKAMEAASQTIMQEVLSCLRVVKAFGAEEREQRRFEEQSWTAVRSRVRLSLHQLLFGAGMSWITRLDLNLILLVGSFHVLHGQLTVGELLVILAYVTQIHAPLTDIGQTLTDMQVSLASAERAMEVLDVRPEIRDRPGAIDLARVSGAVAFERVGFTYAGAPDRRVLRDVSFTARPGEVVAIVGPTGAGKTTVSSLIARFYDPLGGRVTLDGHDLRDLTVKTLRDNIALVIQEPVLFTGSIRHNIAYGRPDASMEAIVAAARAANAHEFISALPRGYDSQVGERGVRLSGGERQRIAIARAFLMDAPVLILDEPTSSVDSRTEAVILDALDRLMVGRTTFIIAHRLSTIRRADQILVIDKGRVAERGTHAELMTQKGLYAQFYRIQSGGLRRTDAARSRSEASV